MADKAQTAPVESATPSHSRGDYQGLSGEQKDDIRAHRDALEIAKDYCEPHFQKGVRYLKLLDGVRPKELDGTFSKVMVEIPLQIVQNEIPRTVKGINFGKYFSLEPKEIRLEQYASQARDWLEYQMESVQNFPVTIIPTLQSTYAMGNGYRVYSHRYRKRVRTERVPSEMAMGIPTEFKDIETQAEWQSIISGQYAHFFSILPQPGGSMPNAVDDASEDVIDGCHWITYMPKKKIKENVEKHGWNGRMAEKMFGAGNSEENDPASDFIDSLPAQTRGGMYGGDLAWMMEIRKGDKKVEQRYRVEWFFTHDRWVALGEGKYWLWAGKGLIDAIPISNHRAIPMLGNWFGRSMIGNAEDLIISFMQNFNARMDYLTQTMHPSTYIPVSLLDHHGGDKSVFDPRPYNIVDYPSNINIATDIFHDRYPELPRQAFMEDAAMNQMIQKVLGQPDILSGQGSGSQADGSATGFMNLMSEGNVRMMQRALNVEATGIHDDLWLTLKYGAKYIDEDVFVRMRGNGGSPWFMIANEAITDGYGIRLSGIKSLDLKEETFRKMISIAQFIVNNPAVENQKKLLQQLMQKSEAFTDEDDIIGNIGSSEQMMPSMGAGGMQSPGQGPIQNEVRSSTNRNTVQQGTGDQVPAGDLLV